MKYFDANTQMLLGLMAGKAEQETLNYVLDGMAEYFGDEMPDAETVKAYLLHPEKDTQLNSHQRFVAMDKMLECAEVKFRASCDLIRYKYMKDGGMVNSMDEFLELFRSDMEE